MALIGFTLVYTRVAKPINAAPTAATLVDRVPADARALQARWDSVINVRVALQATALITLCIAIAAA